MNDFSVSIEFNENVFTSGENVSGIVKVKCPKPLNATCLNFFVDGTACENNSENGQYTTRVYVKHARTVWKASSENDQLNTGTNFFRFSVPLPADCPPSFEKDFGSVKYLARVQLDNEKLWNTSINTAKQFKVISQLSLNSDATGRSVSKTVSENSVTLKVHLPKRGYLINEMLPIRLEIHNNSAVVVKNISILFQQHTSYFMSPKQNFRKKYKKCVETLKIDNHVDPSAQKVITVQMTVPRVPATFQSTVIQSQYSVLVLIPSSLTESGKSLQCEVPVIVGTSLEPSAPPE